MVISVAAEGAAVAHRQEHRGERNLHWGVSIGIRLHNLWSAPVSLVHLCQLHLGLVAVAVAAAQGGNAEALH